MSKLILIATIALVTIIATLNPSKAAVITGETQTTFGKYTLTPSIKCVVINDYAYKTWELTYSNSNEKYTVFFKPSAEKNCCVTIRNEKFEIQYAWKDGQFGAQLVDPSMRTLKKKDVVDKLNYNNFVSQLVLTSNEKTEKEMVELAACFFPLLLK